MRLSATLPDKLANSLAVITAILTTLLAEISSSQALEVQVEPKNPRLGDTLSVVVKLDRGETSNLPTVKLKNQTYKTFTIGSDRYRVLLPTTPLDKPGNWSMEVKNEGEVKKLTVKVANRTFPLQRINLPPGKAGASATPKERAAVKAFKELVTPEQFWNGAFIKPNRGRISSVFGVRRYYNGKFAQDYYHRGVDYAGGLGSPVVAPAAGKVVLVGKEAQGFRVHGNVVGVDHGQGVVSIFMHLNSIKVKEGDFVKPGEIIGTIGSTGAATGPHLHWGLYVQGQSIDPASWRDRGWE
ncbi:M23 family metallopeptidase [Merismopedia glauca]|uniref:Peptidase n=1 Tax=Merismopedia glauca CCAP 1448/3 TaxID=1296344 RepID=A0A2T1C0A4_9CYAN|nr:M23 family metallopeptidase [Merismopedia glauca]PSB01672.1 peptidase [Merismopedia glauca CCAP 1448/3]